MRRPMVVWLVARREILERGRSRGYLFSLLFTIGILAVAFVVPAIARSDETLRLAVVGNAPAALEPALADAARASDVKLTTSRVPDEATAMAQLKAKEIDGALEVPADLSNPGTMLFREAPNATLQAISTAAAVRVGAGASAKLPATIVIDKRSEADISAIVFANAGIILMFIGIFSFGTWVLTGVVEEKQSRVVEVVLSTVRPRDLLVGKVLGIGSLALGQLAALVTVGIVASQVSGQLLLPSTTAGAVAQLVVWFVLGFLFYATAMGALGSLASRAEEANNAALPVTMTATAAYMASLLFAVQDPGGLLARVLTFIPFAAPMVVPLRVALNAIEPWEVVGSILVMLAAIWLLFEAGARVYGGAVLSSGGRMKLREAWRARR